MFSHMRINSLLWYVSCTVPVQTRKQGKKWGCREVAVKDGGMIIGPKKTEGDTVYKGLGRDRGARLEK